MSSNADALALPQTILNGFGLLAVFVAVIALGAERIRRVREYDKGHETTKQALVGCFSNKPVSALGSLMGRHAPVLKVPSIAGLIETADRGLWTSTTLDHMPEIHPELTWVPLYESVFDDLVPILPQLPDSWKTSYSTARVFDKLKSTRTHLKHRSVFADSRRHLLQDGDLVKSVRRLPGTAKSSKDQGKGLARVKATWLVGKKPCIPVTREEFVALSLMMGMPITKSHDGHYSGIGAYGLSIDLAHTEAIWKLSLVKGSRIPRHAPSMGSGYTSLMAKHLACGSIPFAESADWIRSVYVTDEVLTAVKNGLCIMDTRAYGGPSLEFLRRLPGDKAVDAYYGLAKEHENHETGSILDAGAKPVGEWARLVAGIAFGGLVPQADQNVIEAVRFTVGGNVDGCVQNLEYLVDALHSGSPEGKNIFGERVAERTEAKGHIYVNYNYPSSDKNPRDAASTFARYTNLLEHVVARSEKPLVSNTALPSRAFADDGTDLESGLKLPTANDDTQTAKGTAINDPVSDQPSDHVFESTVALLDATYRAAVKNRKIQAEGEKWWHLQPDQRTTLSPEEHKLVKEDLGDSLEIIREALSYGNKIPLEHASIIVRCILAAWADTVPQIDVMEHVPVRTDPSGFGSGAGMISMDAFPSVMALS
ncbi:hypothetical protein G7Z17_g6513 [Cylindrodendrum hubeiense]|uniref:Uncharacterized protein n=1 Tax=Cylindrodendrum hubeiense TaxID=595255 RepID=A0A9P5H9Q1_9HYPO|nr:hypothetical protein G7Z17_g6513 [Cylindrodendrum hubeiense]